MFPLRSNLSNFRNRAVFELFSRSAPRCNGFQCVTRIYFPAFANVNKLGLRSFFSFSSQIRRSVPKEGLSSSQWRRLLHGFAMGDHHLDRWQRPKRDTHWARTREMPQAQVCRLARSLRAAHSVQVWLSPHQRTTRTEPGHPPLTTSNCLACCGNVR